MHRRGAVLRVMCLALMLVVAGVTSLNVALPSIGEDTGASQTQLQWIVDSYALVFAALLLHWFSWHSIFVLNIVLAGLALTGTLLLVPASREARPPRLDPVGTVLSAAG